MSSSARLDIADAKLTLKAMQRRVKGRRWAIYICGEPDGADCESGTHPNILTHRCAAIRDFHDNGGPGPQVWTVEAEAVSP